MLRPLTIPAPGQIGVDWPRRSWGSAIDHSTLQRPWSSPGGMGAAPLQRPGGEQLETASRAPFAVQDAAALNPVDLLDNQPFAPKSLDRKLFHFS